jgi:hypothetical protein
LGSYKTKLSVFEIWVKKLIVFGPSRISNKIEYRTNGVIEVIGTDVAITTINKCVP